MSPTPPLQFSKLWPQIHYANWENTQLTLNLFPLLGTTSLPSLLFQWKWTDLVIEVPKSYPNTRNQGSLGLGRMEGTPTE